MKGRKIGGTARAAWVWANIVCDFRHILPAYPGENLLHPVRTPRPPLLDPRLSQHKQAVTLANMYTRTMNYFVSRRRKGDFESPLKQDRSYILLLEVAPVFVSAHIPPQAWIKFSLDVFAKFVGRGCPKPNWVFSKERLENRQEWFSWEESFNMAQGVVWISPHHHKLLRQHELLKQQLLVYGKLTSRRVQETVDRILPVDDYDYLVKLAQRDYRARRNRFDAALESGEWIWD